jgi:hypothetical protein
VRSASSQSVELRDLTVPLGLPALRNPEEQGDGVELVGTGFLDPFSLGQILTLRNFKACDICSQRLPSFTQLPQGFSSSHFDMISYETANRKRGYLFSPLPAATTTCPGSTDVGFLRTGRRRFVHDEEYQSGDKRIKSDPGSEAMRNKVALRVEK